MNNGEIMFNRAIFVKSVDKTEIRMILLETLEELRIKLKDRKDLIPDVITKDM